MKIVLSGIIVFLLVLSCDNLIDYYEQVNTEPKFLIRNLGSTSDFTVNITDTVKTSISEIIEFEYIFEDEQSINTLDVSYDYSNGNCEISFNEEKKIMTVKAQEYGNNNFVIILTDLYNKAAISEIKLFAFKNLKPIANLSIKEINTGFNLDASGSFDQDARFGGKIDRYEFSIHENEPVELNTPTYNLTGVNFKFPVLVKLRVKDNDDDWSEYYYTTYTFSKP